MTSPATYRREKSLSHAAAIVESSAPSLRKIMRPRGRLKNYLVRGLLAGESARPKGNGGGESKKSNKPSKPAWNVRKGHHNGQFPALIGLKIAEIDVFLVKST
jgi:hypothetical protein